MKNPKYLKALRIPRLINKDKKRKDLLRDGYLIIFGKKNLLV